MIQSTYFFRGVGFHEFFVLQMRFKMKHILTLVNCGACEAHHTSIGKKHKSPQVIVGVNRLVNLSPSCSRESMASNKDTEKLYWFGTRPYIQCRRLVSTCSPMSKCSKRLTTGECKLGFYQQKRFEVEENLEPPLEEGLALLYSHRARLHA